MYIKLMNWIRLLHFAVLDWFAQREWKQLLDAELATVPENDKRVIEPLLKNSQTYILESERMYPNTTIAGFLSSSKRRKMMFKLSATMCKKLVAQLKPIIGIQPMTGPVGLVYYFGVKDKTDDAGNLQIGVLKSTINAQTRKMHATFSMDAMQDIATLINVDVEAAVASALATAAVQEYTVDVINRLTLAGQEDNGKHVPIAVETSMAERGMIVQREINAASSRIGQSSRRGMANFIICSPVLASHLQLTPETKFEPSNESNNNDGINLIGTINDGTMAVYTSTLLSLTGDNERVIVGYNGTSGADSGFILCPYLPIMFSGTTIDATTFAPVMTLMTRYGTHADNATKYYSTIDLQGFNKF